MPLTPGDVAGQRRGIVYRSQAGDGSVRINFGTRPVTFPDCLKEMLEFALTTPACRVRDLAGDLEEGETVVVIERLIEEGLVSRVGG